jgi:hypothetical protein
MKRLIVVTAAIILVLVAIAACSCTEKEPVTPVEGELVASSCVSCHSDKDLLKEIASPEEVEESEATTGEG